MEGVFSEVLPGQHTRKRGSDFSFTLLFRAARTKEGGGSSEKVFGDAQDAEGCGYGGCIRRGRQPHSLLWRLLAQDDDHPDTLLTACANRAHNDSAHDDRGADSAQKNDP